MKRFIIILLFIPLANFGQLVWTQLPNYPDYVDAASGFAIGKYCYIGTGYNPGYNKIFYRYDTLLNSWSGPLNVFPGTAAGYAEGFAINGKGYLACGQNTTMVNEVWEYNPGTNSWTAKANFPGAARTEAASFVIGNKGYLGIGSVVSGTGKDFYEFDPVANTWTQKSNYGNGSGWGAIGFSIGTKGYFCLGNDSTNNPTKVLWEYNPVTNIWTQKTNFPGIGRVRATAFSINGKGYVGGGNDPIFGNSLYDFYEYNPGTNSWTSIPTLSVIPRQSAVSFNLGNTGYVGTGGNIGSPYYNDFWRLRINSTANIEENNGSNGNLFSPNPVVNEITIKTDLKAGDKGKLEIRDITGRKLYEAELTEETKVNVSNFANGTYVANIYLNGILVKAKKFVKVE